MSAATPIGLARGEERGKAEMLIRLLRCRDKTLPARAVSDQVAYPAHLNKFRHTS
jgi:hypothetical protein